jgi:SNF2 family DNA or RNA helicase
MTGAEVVAAHRERFKLPPYRHQVTDTAAVVDHEFYGLFLEMRLGKTKIIVDAACLLREQGLIDSVLVVSPSPVRGVWVDEDPELGEIKKHVWLPSTVIEYHSKTKVVWEDGHPKNGQLPWVVTNFEYLRHEDHREKLKEILHGHRFMMVADESSFIKNRNAIQTKACIELGKLAARRYVLNGTPVTQSPLDLWSQMNFLSPRILPYKNFFQFKADYCNVGGWHNKQILSYKNLDKLQGLVAPYVIRREQKDCLDLPPTLETHVEVPLTEESWKVYKSMRDDAVVWLEENPTLAAQAGTRVMRLSQIASGFLGGFVEGGDDPGCEELEGQLPETKEIGREKLEWLKGYVAERLQEDPTRKIICWCRFRLEIERVARELQSLLPTYKLYGGQSKKDRDESKARFSKLGDPTPALLVAQPQSGGYGLNLIAADVNVYLSQDHSLMRRLQSQERSHGPGQLKNVLYVDVLAVGPKNQKTVDHSIVKALRSHQDLATWTCAAWKQALEVE